MTNSPPPPSPLSASPGSSPLLRDSRVLIYLFVSFRLLMLLVYQPLPGVGAGLTAFGDFQHYFDLASLSAQDKLPYRDYWYEFPPVFPIISLTSYALASLRAPADFTGYATLLGLVMMAFDVGNLLLLKRLGSRLYSDSVGIGLTWVYALLTAPLVFASWTFEPIVAFSILLALYLMVTERDNRSGLVIAFGALTKLFPIALLAVSWRFRPPREAIRATIIAVGLTAIGLELLIVGGPFGAPSLRAQFNKASYETVYALIDHNYKTGNFGPLSDQFDPAKAFVLQGNPPVIPVWLRIIVFGAIGLFVYVRTLRYDRRGLVAFATITIILFFLWSQGWSPQWLVTLIPLILLNFPTRNGVVTVLSLSFVTFVEYPLLFSRTGATNGAIGPALLPLFALLILIRTGILIGVALGLYRRLRIPALGDRLAADRKASTLV